MDDDERDRVFEEFRRGVADAIAPDDTQTHFDLGLAYAEMGLWSDAVHELECAVAHCPAAHSLRDRALAALDAARSRLGKPSGPDDVS